MASNVFDQFDAPQPRGNVFDQFDAVEEVAPARPKAPEYDPMAVAVQSLDARNYAEDNPQIAQASMTPKLPDGAGEGLYQSHVDTQAAQRQHAAPLVRDIKGNYVRKPLGEIEEYDFGPVIRGQDGNVIAFNPKSDVMLRDPQTGRLMAFARDDSIDNPGLLARMGQALLPGMVAGPPTRIASSNAIPMAVQRGAALGFPVPTRTYQLGERARDAAAFGALETEPFAPAFRSKGAARFARTVEEMPVLGGIAKNPKTETELALQNAQARIANELGGASTDEAAGRVLQGGLDRFRTAGIRDVEPSVLAGKGVQARAPGKYVGELVEPMPGSVGQRIQSVAQPDGTLARFDPAQHIVVRDAGRAAVYEPAMRGGVELSKGARRSAEAAAPIREALGGGVAQTSRGVQVPAAKPLNEIILARRNAEDLSDAELMSIARSPAQETSFAARQEALYEAAHRQIPKLMRANDTANPNLFATPNAGRVASGLERAEQSARISGGVLEGRFGKLIKDFQNTSSNFTLDALKSSKTEIGRALASFGNYDARLDRSQLKALYGAASKDYEAALQTLANRAYERTTLSNNRPDHVSAEVARAADRALYEMRRADRYTRVGIERMDRFTKLLNAESPEAAVRSLATKMKEGSLDRGLIRSVRDALRPEERNQVLGYLVARMGQGRPGGKEAETVWNLHGFATDWNKNKSALALLAHGAPAGVVDRLNALARVSERMKYYETTKNYSGSAYAGIPFAGALTGVVGGGPMVIPTLVASVGGLAAMGKFLTSPRYLDWMVQAAQSGAIPRAGGPQVGGSQFAAQLERLRLIAANDNELGPVITQALALLQKSRPAAEGEEPQGQAQ